MGATLRSPQADVAALVARVAGGVVFVVFGLGKFTSHASEAASFREPEHPTRDLPPRGVATARGRARGPGLAPRRAVWVGVRSGSASPA